MTVPRRTRIVLAGAQGFGTVHLENLRRLGDRVELVAVADPTPVPPENLPAGTQAFASLADALDAVDDIDVVIVATPLHTHAALAGLVVSRGIDLYLEKPPVLSSADFAVLADAAAASGARVQVGFQSLGSLAIPALIADEFGIGPIQAIGAVGLWCRDLAYWSRSRWAGHRTLDGFPVLDGVVANPLAHATATALAVAQSTSASDVNQVTADLYRANAIEGDDTSVIRLSTGRGIRVTSALTLCAEQEEDPYVLIRGTRGSARFFYTEDVVETEDRRVEFGRIDLVENLLDHRDHGTPLLAPLHETGAFVRVMDAVADTEPVAIDAAHVTWNEEGRSPRAVITDVKDAVERAVDVEATFAELHLPWAAKTEAAVLADLAAPGEPRHPAAVLVDGADVTRSSSPRPYLHPVSTPGGIVVSDTHPADHDWHLGISVTLQDVSGVNFWGGRTYTPGRDYVWRDDHGRIVATRVEGAASALEAEFSWIGRDGAQMLTEQRRMTVAEAGPGATTIDLRFSLATRAGTLHLGGPGSNGRVGGGYGGLAWRLPAATDVDVRTATARGEDAVHGTTAPWLAWSAEFPTGTATVAMAPLDEGSAADPWFVRVAGYPGIGAALAWDREVTLAPGVPVSRSYRLLVADGRLSDDEVVAALRVG
ncbi:DUF6807 family protein [Microbacterium oleivorans]|uniref:Gfo/Idh/MocA-like oxidoreductase N-terminal domain-containing protein n=1 Tax=Microbacterium oleivorans TaxID=273677 RepID=A0A4R5YN91_9MICO|nr:DUF6807 family protein [Microbacterium oleivorans]TDL46102.1 hypothetical protein E2R54_06660 [Microbacterium oleivorans]